ncbi:hypothetical protein SNE35_02950 [Paucibacter sp. R3-3]|uniref:DUF937 domain-containing protein n=1 Tax=Roseateles agri TaxID=3098619 RepID=A0ABU5DB02_9BURK|nr:hypothetical protein [Paucibacter sp. R3-3]MDY0743441.1 hypothetical protein [Paucibacter sp. R3-3]
MDVQQLIGEFLASEHGAQATQALAAQGVNADDAQQLLGHAASAAYEHVESQQSEGLMGEHAGKSFFSAFAAGLVRGDGFFKSLVDGGEGVMTGRIAETLAARAGIDPATASSIAAAATPYVVAFLKQRLG